MHPIAPERKFRTAVKHGLTRFVGAARPRRFKLRRSGRRIANDAVTTLAVTAIEAERELDPVALTVLAINRLGPAMMRAVVYGRPLVVTVPDARTGEIFRAALAETQQTRCTDRLIDIVVARSAGDGQGSEMRGGAGEE